MEKISSDYQITQSLSFVESDRRKKILGKIIKLFPEEDLIIMAFKIIYLY
jgi:hypothetical protein